MSDVSLPDDAALTLHEIELSELTSSPTVKLLDRYPILPCDGHASAGIQAIMEVRFPTGAMLQLCGNCAHKHGFASHQNMSTWLRAVDSERKQGSEN
jgi:hypothetical protein